MKLNPGTEYEIASGSTTCTRQFTIQSNAVLVSIAVPTILSGTVTVNVYAQVGGMSNLLHSFSPISVATTETIQWTSGTTNATIAIEIVVTGSATYTVLARAIDAASSADTGSASDKKNPQVQVITVGLSEYVLNLPAGTTSFCLRSRTPRSLFVASSSGGDVFTVFPGTTWGESNLDLTSSNILYVTSAQAGSLVELLTWDT